MSNLLELLPILSEKTYKISSSKIYAFKVPKNANKISIKQQIEDYYKVEVQSVNIVHTPGKTKRTISLTGKRYDNSYGKRTDVKKAYVYLKEGFSLPFFDAIEEESKKEQKAQENFDKAAEKIDKKETKKSKTTKKEKA